MLASLGIINIWTYVLGTILVILLPGPNSLFVLASAAQRGVTDGYRAACGILVGDAILITLAALGVASLFRAEPTLFIVLKWIGAAYLFYLGINMLIAGWKRFTGPKMADEPPVEKQVKVSHPFTKALMLSLSNPKAILFTLSFLIQFVDPAYAHPGLSFMVLGVILEFISFLYLSFLIFTGSRLALWFRQRNRLVSGATAGVGALFVGFGLKLAGASLN